MISLLRSLSNIPKGIGSNMQLNPAGVDKYNRKFLKRALERITKEGEESAIGRNVGFGNWFPGTAISGDLASQTNFGTNVLNPLRLAIKDKNADPYEVALRAVRTGSFGEGTKKISSKQRQQLLSALRQMENEKTGIIGEVPTIPRDIGDKSEKRYDKAYNLINKIIDNSDFRRVYQRRLNSPALTKLMKDKYKYYNVQDAVKYGDANDVIDILAKGSAQQKSLANKLRPLSNIYKKNAPWYSNRSYEFDPRSDIKPIKEARKQMMPPNMKQFIESNMRNLIESSKSNYGQWINEGREKLLEKIYKALPDSPRSRETAVVLLKDETPDFYNISNEKFDEIINMARLLEEGM